MDSQPRLHPLVETVREQTELRANSLIVTIFGDALLPRGGGVWLGSLIELARPFGIAERLVRTGVYRLTREGWLTSRSEGRRAHYSLTPQGREKSEEAQQRIYAMQPDAWDGDWTLVHLTADAPADALRQARRELGWLGFGQLGTRLFAHHLYDAAAAQRVLNRIGLARLALVFRAHLHTEELATARNAVQAAWKLDGLKADYADFIAKYAQLDAQLADGLELPEADAFVLRTLLIHEYRRLLLKDPVLPEDLLPEQWTGAAARDLAARIYKAAAAAADRHIDRITGGGKGEQPALAADYAKRFGGLNTSARLR